MLERFVTPDNRVFRPEGKLEERNKYFVGMALGSDGMAHFLKALKDPDKVSVREDLQNEVRWNQMMSGQLGDDFWGVPKVVAHDVDFRWAVFEWIEGQPPSEASLAEWLPAAVADIGLSLLQLPVGRMGARIDDWYRKRLQHFASVPSSEYFDETERRAIDDVRANSTLVSRLAAGIIHGDLSPKNLLVVSSPDRELYLTDAEFGTLQENPDWEKPVLHTELDKPRFQDMAYFYHLLRCQYHRPDLAEGFLDTLWLKLQKSLSISRADFMAEFHLSVLERTISMMSHFVINHSADKQIDDTRRTESRPYVETIRSSLVVLAAP